MNLPRLLMPGLTLRLPSAQALSAGFSLARILRQVSEVVSTFNVASQPSEGGDAKKSMTQPRS